MPTVAELLTASRQAHRAARALVGKRDYVPARVQWRLALESRLQARKTDPDHADPAWGGDLTSLHSRKQFERDVALRLVKRETDPDPEGYDQPSTLTAAPGVEVAALVAQMDTDLEAYFRQQLGEGSANPVQRIETPQVIAPTQWVTTIEGQTPCADCTHGRAQHPKDTACNLSVFKDGQITACDCLTYTPTFCRHTWHTGTTTRNCANCQEQQTLQPTMAIEDTLAFKQLQREGKATGSV